jgi:hypothetical protein
LQKHSRSLDVPVWPVQRRGSGKGEGACRGGVFIERLNDGHEAGTIGPRIKRAMKLVIQAAAGLVRHGALQPRRSRQSPLVAGYVLVRHSAAPLSSKVNHGCHTRGNHGLTEDKTLLKNAPAASFHLWKPGARGCPCPLLQMRLPPEKRLSAARALCFSQPFYRCMYILPHGRRRPAQPWVDASWTRKVLPYRTLSWW